MTSAAWSDRIQDVHEFRRSRNPDRFARVHQQRVHVGYEHNIIFTIPAILYANFNRKDITPNIEVHLQAKDPYLIAFPNSTINQLVIMTIARQNQVDSVVNNITNTLFAVYQRLHTSVEEEITEKR
jgi:endonuclease III